MLFGATLIDLNSPPCGVSGIGNGNPGHFYVTFVEYVYHDMPDTLFQLILLTTLEFIFIPPCKDEKTDS